MVYFVSFMRDDEEGVVEGDRKRKRKSKAKGRIGEEAEAWMSEDESETESELNVCRNRRGWGGYVRFNFQEE